jgi:hypothetical protein
MTLECDLLMITPPLLTPENGVETVVGMPINGDLIAGSSNP